MRNLVGLFLVLIGSISSDVIGWCYKKISIRFGVENKRMLLIYILQNDTIVELVTSGLL